MSPSGETETHAIVCRGKHASHAASGASSHARVAAAHCIPASEGSVASALDLLFRPRMALNSRAWQISGRGVSWGVP